MIHMKAHKQGKGEKENLPKEKQFGIKDGPSISNS